MVSLPCYAKGILKSTGFCLSLLILTAHADSDFTFSGFGSVGVVHDNSDKIGFMRNASQPISDYNNTSLRTDTIIGLQANYTLTPQWQLVGQLVGRHQQDTNFNRSLEWAYAHWQPDEQLDFRFGRVGADVFMLSDYRHVGFAQTWVRPPNEFYTWIPFYSINGGDASFHFNTGETHWHLKGQIGSTSTRLPTGKDEVYNFQASKIHTLSLRAEKGPWQFMGAASSLHVTSEAISSQLTSNLAAVAGAAPPPFSSEAAQLNSGLWSKGARVEYRMLGIGYQQGPLQFQSEVAKVSASSPLFPSGLTGYAMFGYRVGDITPYVVLSSFRPDRKAKLAQNDWSALVPGFGAGVVQLQNLAVAAYNTYRIDQSTLALGMRWDVNSRTALKLQVDRKWIGARGYGLWQINNVQDNGQDRRVNVISAVLDFTF